MTIGTDNKSSNFITHGGRVKAGAKGIGRFALDKLGERCEMFTFFDPTVHNDLYEDGKPTGFAGYHWVVNWNEFDGANKTIDNVGAELDGISDKTYMDYLNELPLTETLKNLITERPVLHGTILKITQLRDIWDSDATKRIYDDLGVLVPPTESREFVISLQALDEPKKYGEVESSFCDDFDYKVVAHADENQNVEIRVYRQEYNTEAIPLSYFDRNNQKNYPYRREDFLRGYWDTTSTFSQLIPGFHDADTDSVLSRIGSFDFTFYYLKRSATRDDEIRFFYRQCPYNLRKSWLDKYGGIKLFRDSFRVRPYGEKNDAAFDWLGLGMRKNNNPASNLKIGHFSAYDAHPLMEFNNVGLGGDVKYRGISVSINTDDRGVFGTSIEREYSLLAAALEKQYQKGTSDMPPRVIYNWLDRVREMAFEQKFD